MLCWFSVVVVLSAGNFVTADKACPFKPADLIFLLDGSGSEGFKNFNTQLQFVKNFTDQFEIGPNNTRVSLVTFATNVHNEFYLNQYLNKSSVLQHIDATQYPDGETNTHMALNFVQHQTLLPAHDGRHVRKIVIVMTDGQSLQPDQTKANAMKLKANPLVTVVAIGIGRHVDPAELLAIASDANNTYQVIDFDALSTIQTELTDTACNVCKNDMSDICFVLDSSGSEGPLNFQKQLEFVNMVVNEFSFDGTSATQLCVVTFSTQSHTEFSLNQYHDTQQILTNVLRIPYRDGETRTDLGINSAYNVLTNKHGHGGHAHASGVRRDSNKIIVVLTDGRSTEPLYTSNVAHKVHRKGIDTFAIGIGSGVDPAELNSIASDHDHVFEVANFDQLDGIHQHVVDKICAKNALRITTTTPKPTTPTTTPVPTTSTTMPSTTTKAACGLKPADIVFVLDSSDSEGQENFKTEIDFVYNFAAQFSIGVNNVQFSVVTFSSDVRNDFYFNTFHSRHAVLNAIRNIQYIGQGTNTSTALAFVRQNNLAAANGARANSTKFVIVITDGRSDDPDSTKYEASLLHKQAQVISIGVGPKVDKQELSNIASNHHVVQVDSFALLQGIKNQLTDLACESG